METKDCGPACIKIITKYYGKEFDLNYLYSICGLTNEGVSFFDICYVCEKIGFRALSFKFSWKELLEVKPLPCIVHWNRSHFVVAYKITDKHIFVSDPASGLLKYTTNDFKKGWLGSEIRWAVLIIEPIDQLK